MFYAFLKEGHHLYFDKEESFHCIKVLRHQAGDIILATDGKGAKYKAIILQADQNQCILEVTQVVEIEILKKPLVHIAISPTKNIDRLEWFLEKAVEIGVNQITLLTCKRSERKNVKEERFQKIAISAMKQSLRHWLPTLNTLTKCTEFFKIPFSNQNKYICHCQHHTLPLLKNIMQLNQDAIILIGPEGDFSNDEIEDAEKNGYVSVSLGNARLRTETAGIVAVHTFQMLNSFN
ncbi:MAG: 16S rRNA (uracil(1498)-N(3))-methyltransferase [Chitinophagales bacterium]|nr:16S rRNA (uracil(1498)-N(3))-methyltransferase [Chitinophagales bacterium]